MPTISGTVTQDGAPAAGRIIRAYRRDTGALLGQTASSDGSPIPGDDNIDDVSLLLHLDGLVDSSPRPKVPSLNSGSVISAAAARFGSGGLQVAGGGLTVPSHVDFALPGDFTLELSFYVVSWSPSLASLFNIGAFNSGALFRVQPSTIELWINGANTNVAASIAAGQWHHIEWSRVSGSVYVFLNGALLGTVTNAGAIAAGNVLVGVSAHNGGEYINGYIDDIRLTKGLGRHTASFTPPAQAYPNGLPQPAPPTGTYSLATAYTGEVQVVCLDDAAGTVYNDQILRTTPV